MQAKLQLKENNIESKNTELLKHLLPMESFAEA